MQVDDVDLEAQLEVGVQTGDDRVGFEVLLCFAEEADRVVVQQLGRDEGGRDQVEGQHQHPPQQQALGRLVHAEAGVLHQQLVRSRVDAHDGRGDGLGLVLFFRLRSFFFLRDSGVP